MTLKPRDSEELARQIRATRQRIEHVDLSDLRAIREYTPEDMTATVESGIAFAELQSVLRAHGQWVPLDPSPEATVAEILAYDLSGPRRVGYGTAREYLIGMRAVLGSGEIVRTGGKVVKNVAGYDLGKLFIGARHSLGIVVEATFKLRPLPEKEMILQKRCGSLQEAVELARAVNESIAGAVVLDLHNTSGELRLVTAFAGFEDDVGYQVRLASDLGIVDPANLEYDTIRRNKQSVLPSKLFEVIKGLRDAPFVARLGNGVVYHEGSAPPSRGLMPNNHLVSRIKQTYDPGSVLPEYSP